MSGQSLAPGSNLLSRVVAVAGAGGQPPLWQILSLYLMLTPFVSHLCSAFISLFFSFYPLSSPWPPGQPQHRPRGRRSRNQIEFHTRSVSHSDVAVAGSRWPVLPTTFRYIVHPSTFVYAHIHQLFGIQILSGQHKFSTIPNIFSKIQELFFQHCFPSRVPK